MKYSRQDVKKKKEHIVKSSSKKSYRIRKYMGYVSAVIVIALVFACLISAFRIVRGWVNQAQKIDELDLLTKGTPSVMYDIAGKEIQTLKASDIDSEYIAISDIPSSVQQAFVAVEDKNFYKHHGVDMSSIIRSVYEEMTGNDKNEKSSDTITNQLIENQIMENQNEDTVSEKISATVVEQFLAADIEKSMSKKEILEYYLNTINLGDGIMGVQAASKRYFDKDVADVTVSEAAVLASIVADPAKYEPVSQQENNAEKRKDTLKKMLEERYISEDEYEDALGDDVYLRVQNISATKINTKDKLNSYYTDAVAEQIITDLKEKLGYTQTQAYHALYRGGLQIYTCQDSSMQSICDSVINDDQYYPAATKSYLTYSLIVAKDGITKEYSEIDVKNYIYNTQQESISLYFHNVKKAKKYVSDFKKYILNNGGVLISENIQLVKQPQVSFVLLEQSTGRVKAIVGGRGQRVANRAINRATEAKRQPGSAFGILSAYLPALDTSGMTLGTMLKGSDENQITMRDAIVTTNDFAATGVLEQVSVRTGYEYLRKLGFSTIVMGRKNEDGRTESDMTPALATGRLTDGVTNLELTAAYAAIANKGIYQKPRFYTKIVDANGEVLLENEADSTRVMKESSSWLLTDTMQEIVNEGMAGAVKFRKLNVEQAGMIGNTQKHSDRWFEGYTPYYTAGIWTGQEEGNAASNTDYQLTLWREIMERIHKQKKLSKGKFSDCTDIISSEICTECGKKAVEGLCSKVQNKSYNRTEFFAIGTQPAEKCDCHMKYRICKASGQLAGENCPEKDIYEKVIRRNLPDKAKTGEENEIPEETCEIHNKQE